jgi:cell division protein FtsQ
LTPEPHQHGRGRPGRRWVVAAVCLVAVAALCAGLVRTPIFRARVVEIRGNEQVSDAKVRRLAGIEGSTNVVLFDRSAAVAALERDPWIARATIDRRLPSTLDVQIRERTPIAAAPAPGGFSLVADDGSRLGEVATPHRVPVIVSAEPDLASAGPSQAPSDAQLVAAVRALRAMSVSVRESVDRVAVSPDGLELDLRGGVRVSYGPPIQTEEKARSLGAVLRWADSKGERLGSIDLGVPQAPTASPPEASPPPSAPSTPTPSSSSSPSPGR